MTFGDLALIGLAGLAGPLLAMGSRFRVPIVVGEIVAGIIFGRTGFGLVASTTPFAQFLSQAGFAVLMLVVGLSLPLRTPGLRRAARTGVTAATAGLVLALPVAFALSRLLGIVGVGPLIIVLAACSTSATVPILRGADLPGDLMLTATAWVIAADGGMIIAMPVVLHPSQAVSVVIGAATVTSLSVGSLFATRRAQRLEIVKRLRANSRERGWAIDLRMSLVGLFALCFIAQHFSLSVLVAGFSGGVVIALLGSSRRLFIQLLGVGEGFLIPLFFVTLGARLQLRALVTQPHYLLLTVLLVGAIVVIRIATATLLRLPLAIGLAATAQLGVPAAVVSIGLTSRSLTAGAAAAIMTAAVATLGTSSLGVLRLSATTRPVLPLSAQPGPGSVVAAARGEW